MRERHGVDVLLAHSVDQGIIAPVILNLEITNELTIDILPTLKGEDSYGPSACSD